MFTPEDLARVVLIGIGATALMDAWLLTLARLGLPSSGLALIGRWVGHLLRGRFVHASIAKAEPIRAELALGWLTHYVIGIAYAGMLVGLAGLGWVRQPTLLPALAFGVATVVAPLFVMQPAMGAGFAASRTPAPLKNCLRSLANHSAFGIGLFFAAHLISPMPR
jgi:hypothetical protein